MDVSTYHINSITQLVGQLNKGMLIDGSSSFFPNFFFRDEASPLAHLIDTSSRLLISRWVVPLSWATAAKALFTKTDSSGTIVGLLSVAPSPHATALSLHALAPSIIIVIEGLGADVYHSSVIVVAIVRKNPAAALQCIADIIEVVDPQDFEMARDQGEGGVAAARIQGKKVVVALREELVAARD
ncbi:hypothetical protein ACH5RR_032297 [Cinchona calisaya]|uniref:Uncharacterized protein n=1 Tax=Cinchona calisaya TaxID=153742 RepID=A0ABD2YHP8_9GENT